MKLWKILRGINNGKIKNGDKFRLINAPITMTIGYVDGELIYLDIMGDKTSLNTGSLCSGEIDADFEWA